jgi:prevent-host-death family protein
MFQVTPEEAKGRLAELIEAAMRGERVVIARDNKHAVQLVPLSSAPGQRRAGTAKGLITMREDFDAPLPDFDEYTR